MKVPKFRNAIRMAKEVIARNGVTEPAVDVKMLAEREGMIFEPADLEEDVAGYVLTGRISGGPPVLGWNITHPLIRQRFTIAHGMAFHVLHPEASNIFPFDLLMYFRGPGARRPVLPPEYNAKQHARGLLEANAFAMALLMPEEFLHRDFAKKRLDVHDEAGVRLVAQRYQVTVAALTIRLVELDMLRGA